MATLITGSGVDKVIDGSIVDADIVGVSSSKLTGALPAVDGSAVTGLTSANLTGALPALDGSSLTNMAAGGKVKYFDVASLAADGSVTGTPTAWTSTGASITIPAASIAGLSKIIIIVSGSTRVNKNGHTHADFGVQRTAPSSVSYDYVTVGDAAADAAGEIYDVVDSTIYDASLGTGDHTYTVYFRKAAGTASYAANVYYKYSGWRLLAIGI